MSDERLCMMAAEIINQLITTDKLSQNEKDTSSTIKKLNAFLDKELLE